MAEDLPDLRARLRLDTSELDKAVGRAASVGGAIGGALGGIAGGALSDATAQITTFVTGSVDSFAELEDATAAAGVLFGSSVDAITSKAADAASKVGLSQQQYIDAAATIGTFGQAAGLQGKPLTDFTTKLADLSGDLASFKGTSTEQAVEAVGAALRGESEPIRAYGVLLDEATIKQEAQRMGLVKSQVDHVKVASAKANLGTAQERLNKVLKDSNSTDAERAAARAAVARAEQGVQNAMAGSTPELTKQQKLLATQSAIMRQTTNAQGDFARTSDSTANTQKRLAAEAANAQAQLGQRLAPAMTALRLVLIQIVTGFADMFGWIQQNIGILGPLAAFIAVATVVLNAHAIATKVVAAATKIWTAVQAGLNLVMSLNPIGIVVIAIAALVAAIVIAYNRSATFRAIVQTAFAAIRSAISSSMVAARAVVAAVMAFIHGNVSGRLAAVRAVVGAVFGFIVGFIGGQLAAARAIISGVLNVIVGLFTGDFGRARDGAVRALGGLLRFVSGIPRAILSALRGLGGLLLGVGGDIVQGLVDGLRGAAGRVVEAARELASHIPDAIKKLLHIGSPSRLLRTIGSDTGEGFVLGIEDQVGAAGAAAQRMADAAAGASADAASGLSSSLTIGGSTFVELSPASLAALAAALPDVLVRVLLDSDEIAARVDTKLGRDVSALTRSGG